MSITTVIQAVPVINLYQNEKLPIMVVPITRTGLESTVDSFTFSVKPTGAGSIEINNNQYFFVPYIKYDGLGLINVYGRNSRGKIVIGQIHFQVKRFLK